MALNVIKYTVHSRNHKPNEIPLTAIHVIILMDRFYFIQPFSTHFSHYVFNTTNMSQIMYLCTCAPLETIVLEYQYICAYILNIFVYVRSASQKIYFHADKINNISV